MWRKVIAAGAFVVGTIAVMLWYFETHEGGATARIGAREELS